ncbi:M24 family metallopeptidase [Candidatus Woesearchaeota archaeon]|nr:M24 family metallopeptidase [Candidatus Woesearchaeota archaeon]
MNPRIKSLKKRLNTDLALFVNKDQHPNPNFLYFTKRTNVSGILVIPKESKEFLLTNTRDYEKAKNSNLKTFKFEKAKQSFEYLSEILDKKKIKTDSIGIDKENFNLLVYEKLKKQLKGKYEDLSQICKDIRIKKSELELKYLKKACKITDDVFSRMLANFNFHKEIEIKNFIEIEIKKQNADISFPPIAASGKNSSVPHYDKLQRLKKGFLIMDFGAKYKGYHADMTRTIYLGKPSKKEIEMYDLVLSVQEKCLEKINSEMKCSDLFEFAADEFGKYFEKFIHGLGHGVGLEIHEKPNIGPESDDVFHKNSVITIEPGLYFENRFGIRIEDTVLLDDKVKRLTKSDKRLFVVGF